MLRSLLLLSVATTLACAPPNVFHSSVHGETTIQGSSLGGLLSAFPAVGGFTGLDFDQNQDFRNKGVTKDQVDSVLVESITLKILNPNSQDFSFLDTLQFTARAGSNEAEIAHKTGISDLPLPAPNPELLLDLEAPELKPFVTAPSMNIEMKGTGRQPPQDTQVQATVNLKITVHVL